MSDKITMQSSLRFEIPMCEVIDSRFDSYLPLLKEKGAPISGTFALEIEDGWNVLSELNPFLGTAIFIFERTL